MSKAAPEEQAKLLELQVVDSRLHGLDVLAQEVKSDPRLADGKAAVDAAKVTFGQAEADATAAQRQLTDFEDQAEKLRQRIQRDEERLAAGGLSKDLLALQNEIATLTERQSEVEERELEAMQLAEDAGAVEASKREALEAAQQHMKATVGELQGTLAELSQKRRAALEERTAVAGTIEASLLGLYERILAKNGIGAARLFHGVSEGSGMRLSPGDLAELTALPADQVAICPDSGVILVRNDEWN